MWPPGEAEYQATNPIGQLQLEIEAAKEPTKLTSHCPNMVSYGFGTLWQSFRLRHLLWYTLQC